MLNRTIATSPLWYARLGGALYLVIILFGAFSEGFVNSKLMAADAATTAHNIIASPGLWRVGTAANLIVVLCAVPLLWIEFQLLRTVSKSLALLALLLNGVSLAVEAVSKLFQLLVLPILQSADYLQAWGPARVALLANLALKSHDVAFNIALVFFGLTCLVNGYLIIKSRFLPAVLGILLQVAGAAYLLSCLAALFAPVLADWLIPGVLLPPLIGELSLCLWLLIKGVNIPQWQAQMRLHTAGSTIQPLQPTAHAL
ncbi:DUF4386 domain-containing protein [Hymenobacter glaciei]|uniref:DUF4386 domain-containing protein n=1 Tax=Hymenobacter glaciei TaxID=877209 RepID=A0ABP7TBG1_9BACT